MSGSQGKIHYEYIPNDEMMSFKANIWHMYLYLCECVLSAVCVNEQDKSNKSRTLSMLGAKLPPGVDH